MRLYSRGDEDNYQEADLGDDYGILDFIGGGTQRLRLLWAYVCGRIRYHPRTMGKKIVEMREEDGVLTVIWSEEPHLNERRAMDAGWATLGTGETVRHQVR